MDGKLMPLWFMGQQFPDELMKPAKSKAQMMQNPVCNEETPYPGTINNFQHLLQKTCCTLVWNWVMSASQAMKKMNPTPKLLIMTVTVMAVTMKCTPDYNKYGALKSLHDMAYYK